ncbi:GNAT family protein [Pseudonocardia adelaidensis]|uniref:hypothetical protein n=1 Tax=Pseudonocardia adelaidensis TaxID=648754 RepID=UPI003CD0A8B2
MAWEDDLADDEHGRLAGLLGEAFPHPRADFSGTRSWSSGRPELRLVAWRSTSRRTTSAAIGCASPAGPG